MTKVIKDGMIMAARDNHQLAAFLNNGWVEIGTAIPQSDSPLIGEAPPSFSGKDIEPEGGPTEKKYSRSDIQRMNKAELQELARDTGVEGVEDMTGAGLKEHLFNVFGL